MKQSAKQTRAVQPSQAKKLVQQGQRCYEVLPDGTVRFL